MSRIPTPTLDTATSATAETYAQIQKAVGKVPLANRRTGAMRQVVPQTQRIFFAGRLSVTGGLTRLIAPITHVWRMRKMSNVSDRDNAGTVMTGANTENAFLVPVSPSSSRHASSSVMRGSI